MLDLTAPEHSVLREKVVEHIFLAELSRSLLLDLGMPFEVLRAEFDAFGYDLVIEANGILRHVQLKATVSSGARAHVEVQVALANKAGGCVVWMFVDPATLALGPYLWLGGEPGRPLPPLGDREVKHSRGDATGEKKVRSGLRRVPKGEFTRFKTMQELALAMFGDPKENHDQLLRQHLAARGVVLREVRAPVGMTWANSAEFAYMVDGYALGVAAGLLREESLEEAWRYVSAASEKARRDGGWAGTLLELWTALFLQHRLDHFDGPIGLPEGVEIAPVSAIGDDIWRDELCRALASILNES
jgi:hypothetical protein